MINQSTDRKFRNIKTTYNDNFFDNLFSEYQINRVKVKRSISADASKRGQLTELLILN